MEEYRRWEDNIKMDLNDIGVDVMNWMELGYTLLERHCGRSIERSGFITHGDC